MSLFVCVWAVLFGVFCCVSCGLVDVVVIVGAGCGVRAFALMWFGMVVLFGAWGVLVFV